MTRLDIACILDTGEMVDIEVQVTNYHNMQRRTMYYWSRMYLMSLPPGGHYQDLKPCITVNLLKFNLLPQKDPVSMWSIYNPQTGDRLNKDLVFYFLEVPKYSKLPPKPIKEMSKIERWLTYFANNLTKKEKEELIMSDPAIREATKSARVFLQNRKERLAYINRELAELDYNSERKSLIEEGENKLGKLIAKLAQENKFADMSKAAVDPDFREKLYKAYNIE